MTKQDGSMRVSGDVSFQQLFHSMEDALKKKEDKKLFIKKELRIKPLQEVCKHSFNDDCSPMAIVDFKLLQAAFKHFSEATEGDSQPFSKESNRWKDRYFISNEDSQEVASEESELEKALNDLQMSEISNNISDPEVLDFCNNQFSEEKSFSDSLFANVPGELSPYRPELTPTKNVANHVPTEHLNLSGREVLDQNVKISKPVKRKRTPFNTRKKRKKILLSKSNVPKSILVRSANSTDSSEMCFPMSETQELEEDNKDSCTAEEHYQSNLNVQEHQLGNIVSSSTKKKVVSKSTCRESKKKLKKRKNILKVKITRSPQKNDLPSQAQSSAIPSQMLEVEDCDKTTSEVYDSSETVLEDLTLIQISEQQSGKSPKTLNEAVLQTQNPIHSSPVFEAGNEDTCEISGTSPKTDLLPQTVAEVQEKLVKSPATKSTSKGELHVDSIQPNRITDYNRISPTGLLDYEYDDVIRCGLSETESLSPADEDPERCLPDEEMHSGDVSDGVNNSYDIEVASKASSELTCSHANESTPNTEPAKDSPKASNSLAKETLPKDQPVIASPRVTRSSRYAVSEETSGSSVEGNVDVSKDIDMRLQWFPPRIKEGGKKRLAAFSDEEDSDSDSEQSFKRRNNISPLQPQYQNMQKTICHKEQVHSSSNTKLVAVPERHLEKFDSVLDHVRSLCANHEIVEAINTTNKYLEISNSRSVRLEIFEEIILGIADSVSSTDEVPTEDLVKETFEKLKAFIDNPAANKKEDWRFCSKVIRKYFQHPLLIEFALDLSSFCQTKSISIDNRAVEAYAANAMSRNYPTPTVIKFLDYVKRVCKLGFPKSLLRKVLERVTRGKECYLLPEFGQLCGLLCRMDSYEFASVPLRSFLEICVENDCWEEAARCFVAWAAKGHFPGVLLKILRSRIGEAGILFKKLAAEVYGSGEPDAQCKAVFGLTGLVLMLESYHTGLSDKDNPKNALLMNANDVLYTLHKYGVNCFDVGESWRSAELLHKSRNPDPATVICFPYSVVFAAIKICLGLEKPKNAFLVIRNYSSKLCELPAILDQSLKSTVRVQHVNLFLEVTKSLQHTDPVDTYLSAFQELVATLEKGTFLEDLKGYEDVNLKEIESIYNDLLVAYMNKSLAGNVFDLYQYSRGPCEAVLPIRPQVLRGLVVTFAKYQRMDLARSLFALGCHQKIYELQKPQPDNIPFHLNIESNLTSIEMRFSIEKFLTNLLPILSKEKPSKTKFEDWFALKIVIKEFPSTPSLINCLIEPLVPNSLSRACSVLNSIYPEFTWKQFEDYIFLTPSTLYSYFYKNYAELKGKAFNVIQSRPLAFGMDSDSATNLSSRSSTETQAYPDKGTPSDHFSPARHHFPGEVSSTTSDHGLARTTSFEGPDNPAKRRISFNSSERSSSRTPESRPSADRDSRPLQREPRIPFPGVAFGEPVPENRQGGSFPEPVLDRCHSGSFAEPVLDRRHIGSFAEPALDRRHIGSFAEPALDRRHSGLFAEPNKDSQDEALDYPDDMSELGNYRCKQFSPRCSTQSFSPVVSHQSPRKAFPVQSPKQKDSCTVSPRGILHMDKRAGAFQAPKKHAGKNKKTSPKTSTFLNTCTSPKLPSPEMPPRRSNRRQNLDNDFISQCKNKAPSLSLLRSPPKNSLWVGDESELPIRNTENLNMSSQEGHAFENFSIKTGSSGFSRIAKPSGSKKVIKLKKPATITLRKPISVNSSIDKDIKKNIKLNKPKDQKLYFKPIPESNPTDKDSNLSIPDKPASPEHSSPSSSPELSSILTAPKQKAKQRLPIAKETRLPPYRIPTPCKQAKVIRPCTPIAHSSSLRCKTPMSFQCGTLVNLKRTIGTASDRQRGVLHTVAPATKVPIKFEKLTVSLGNSSAGRVITANPSQNSATNSKASAIPTFQRPNLVQARCSNNVPKNVFDKIVTFLKSKVLLKFRNIDPNQLLERATTLANTFVENHSVQRLDSKIMKRLCEFAKSI